MQEFQTVITPAGGWFNFNLQEVWKYRDLIFLFVRRNFVALYKQTILGPAWAVIQPLLTTVMFTVIFGKLAGLSAKGTPAFLFYLCGTIAWGYFSGCLIQISETFTRNAAVLGKVYFPRLVMPFSAVLSGLISFAIQFGMFLLFYLYFLIRGAVHPTWCLLLLPLILLQMALLAMGFGIIVSALTAKYRDLALAMGFGMQLWMYATPVAYDVSIVPAGYVNWYMLNPMTPVIVTFRHAFLGIGRFDLHYYLTGWGTTLLVLLIGMMLFSRVEKNFIDTI